MNINYEYYKIFCYVARYGGITAAAKELCISQPAVSQTIRQLEDEIGISLFTRTAKGVVLNQAGELLFDYVNRGFNLIETGEDKIKELMGMENGEVRIGASDMTLRFFLLPYLERFHMMYPNIKVVVTNAPTPETMDHLYAGRIDFGIVTTPFEKSSRIKVMEARQIKDIFIAGNKFEYLKGKRLSYKNLKTLPIVCLENRTSTRSYVDAFLKGEDIVLAPEFELATSDMIVQFVARNLGVGSVVSDFADEYIRRKEVFKLDFAEDIPSRNMCIIRDAKEQMSVAAERLFELLNDPMVT